MKDYISKLSDEELEKYGRIVSGKILKGIFKSNPKEYQSLSYGKRPEALNYEECIALVVKKRKYKFIQTIMNNNADYIVNETLKHIEENTDEETDTDKVLAQSIISFGFDQDVVLFLKLTERPTDEEYVNKITALIDKIRQETEQEQQAEPEESEEIQTAPDAISEMETRLSEMEQREQKALEQHEAEKTAHESDAARHKEEVESLKKQLSDSQTKISQPESELNRLLVFDDSEVARSISSDYQHISLCRVWGRDKNEIPYVKRMADIDQSGFIHLFITDESREKTFDNRSRLYHRDGPVEIGKYGVWEWSAFPNADDITKDKVKCRFSLTFVPIEIIYLSNCDSIDGILSQLISGIDDKPVSSKTIFAVRCNEIIQGICCTEDHLKTDDGKIKLIDQVTALPVYQFEEKNCIQIASKVFFNNISLGKPVKIERIKDSFDIIRQIILENINWTSFKQRGVNKAEWRNYRAYIEELHSADIIERISKECLCSEKEAEELLRKFTDRASQYISGDSIEDEILLSVISVNADLMERCKNLITDDWQEENRQKIDEADRSIQEKTEQIEALSAEMTKIENNIVNLTNAKKRIEQEIHEKEKLAVDVRKNVDIIITKAQEHAAEFIASMAFVNTNGNTPVKVEKGSSSCFTSGTTILSEQVEEYEDWKDLINNLSDNLIEAGVCSKHSESFAAFLYSSYLNHFPLLLSGPNASEIADAFSASLFGKTACILECVKDYNRSIISALLASEDEIIKICNPFTSEWISSITRLSTYSGKYCIAVHPFAEDIVIEPKGITHYFYPVLTEMLVSHVPECKFLSVCYSGNYQDYQHITPKGRKAGILKDMHMSMLTYNRINDVIFNLHKMLSDDSSDYDVLYAVLPYAYMTMQTDKLLDAVNQEKIKISKDLSDELNRLFGDE